MTPLFDFNDIGAEDKKTKTPQADAGEIQGAFEVVTDLKNAELQASLGGLENNCSYMSDGSFSQHELLTYLLALAGPSEVYLSTWGLSMEPVTRLFELKKHGLVKSVHALLDFRIRDRKPEPLQMLETFAEVSLGKSHAKLIVCIGEKRSFSVISSANFTRNPNMEAGVRIVGLEHALKHKEWILQKQKPFKK